MKLVLLLPLFLVACHSSGSPSHQDAEIQDADVVDADARSESPDAADASTGSPKDDATAKYLQEMERLRGDCPDGGPSEDTDPTVNGVYIEDLDVWLKTHHARFSRADRSCWETSVGSLVNLCGCDRELRLPDRDAPLLHCTRGMENSYGMYIKTILYALEGNTLRVVLEQATGMSSSNFEMAVPGIDFVPRIRGNTLVFEEPYCKVCRVALEFFAKDFELNFKKAHADYKKVCSLDSWEWRWSQGQLKKYRRALSSSSPVPIPIPSSTN